MTERLRRRDHAALVQLADGTLTGAAQRRAEARLRAIPDGDRLIERQRRVARALGVGVERPACHVAGQAVPALRLPPPRALPPGPALLVLLASLGGDPTAQRA